MEYYEYSVSRIPQTFAQFLKKYVKKDCYFLNKNTFLYSLILILVQNRIVHQTPKVMPGIILIPGIKDAMDLGIVDEKYVMKDCYFWNRIIKFEFDFGAR